MAFAAARVLLLAAHRSPAVLAALTRLRPPRRDAFNPGRWEREYQAGGWDWLWSAREAVHHHVIAGFCARLGGTARVLDMGCGEAILREALRGVGYAAYLGVDLSPTAIARASAFADERTRFVVGDADEFDIAEEFDMIVFNECIYYLSDPPGTLARLSRRLSPRGVFAVSTAMGGLREGLHMLAIWHALQRSMAVRDEITMLYANGPLRIVKCLQPRRP